MKRKPSSYRYDREMQNAVERVSSGLRSKREARLRIFYSAASISEKRVFRDVRTFTVLERLITFKRLFQAAIAFHDS